MRSLLLTAVFLATIALGEQVAADAKVDASKGTVNEHEDALKVSDSEKLSRSAAWLEKMRLLLAQVIDKLEEARNTKDVAKLNCVNEKLTLIKGLLRISDQAGVALQEAVAKKDADNSADEYTKISIANGRVTQLRSDAEQCIGQLAFLVDVKLLLDVDEPKGLPKGDLTKVRPFKPVPLRDPPGSPTL